LAKIAENIPDSRSYFRIVWKITAAGNDTPNTTPLPLVLYKRVLYVVCENFSGTFTLYRGIFIDERGSVAWDTELSATLNDGSLIIREIPVPAHFYYPSLNPASGYTGPILVWVQLEGV